MIPSGVTTLLGVVIPLRKLGVTLRSAFAEWWRVPWRDLELGERATTILALSVLIGISLLALLARRLRSSKAGRTHVTLPALLPMMRSSSLSTTRHLPFLLFLVGLPFFAVALADPHTPFTRDEVTYPGRRIAIVLDGSTSMLLDFEATSLRRHDGSAFYTAAAAAEHFMRLRMDGPYRDLVALIEFGNESYVVTPFTTDYENVLLGLHLASDPRNWGRFDDWGTTISQGIRQGTELFRAFDFLNASGNLMLLFSDGRDDQVESDRGTLDELIDEARKYQIPIYMIRIANDMLLGDLDQDDIWKAAIERTGGRFYAAANEETILRAAEEIDKLSAGRIDVREYTAYRPRFSGYALMAVCLWATAALLKLGVRHFRTFP